MLRSGLIMAVLLAGFRAPRPSNHRPVGCCSRFRLPPFAKARPDHPHRTAGTLGGHSPRRRPGFGVDASAGHRRLPCSRKRSWSRRRASSPDAISAFPSFTQCGGPDHALLQRSRLCAGPGLSAGAGRRGGDRDHRHDRRALRRDRPAQPIGRVRRRWSAAY